MQVPAQVEYEKAATVGQALTLLARYAPGARILAGGRIADIGIGLTAVGAAHFVAAEAEEFLSGRLADEEAFARAGEIAAAHCNPAQDQRGPVAYKRHLVGELTVRVLRTAVRRALGLDPAS